jgi:hypothetical protein
MNLQELLDFINFIINKEQSGKYVSPSQYTLLLISGSYKFFKKYFDVPEEYQIGMPMSRIQWEITDVVREKLSRFWVAMDSVNALTLTQGFAEKPTNMFFTDYFTSPTGGVGSFRKGYQFDSQKNNVVTSPTEVNPIGTIRGGNLEFAPSSMETVNFYYLRRPLDPYFDFYVDDNDNVIYLKPGETSPASGATPASHASLSVELDWDIDCILDIIEIILEDIGVGINRSEIVQYANQKQVKGV